MPGLLMILICIFWDAHEQWNEFRGVAIWGSFCTWSDMESLWNVGGISPDADGQASRKVSLQRYLEKKKDRYLKWQNFHLA